MPDSFGIGVSALQSLQTAIKTTGQNIANVNTEGYSRQSVNFVTNPPDRVGSYFVGAGVTINSIDRAYDEFLTRDVQNRTASSSLYANLAESAGRVDELFADPATGIGPALSELFSAMEAVANSPTTLPERQVLISQAGTLAERFEYFDNRLSDFQDDLNIKITSAVTDVNQFGEVIAELNDQIALQTAQSNGSAAGDLLDQRDEAIRQLSELVGTTTQSQDDGAINIFIGDGQPLVIGSTVNKLVTVPDTLRPGRLNILLTTDSGQVSDVTNFMSGGSIGASLTAYEDVIEQARRDIGVLAVGLTVSFNEVHSQGFDLNDNTGADFFDPAASEPVFFAAPSNTGVLSLGDPGVNMTAVIFDANPALSGDVAELTGDSYRLDYSAGNLSVVNLTTGTSTNYSSINGGGNFSEVVDGVRISIDAATIGNLADGDSFLLEPTRTSAEKFSVAITDATQVAVAQDTSSPGDNRNILDLISLRDTATLQGDSTYFDFYTNTTSRVAVQTRRANSLAETESSLLSSAQARQSNLNGVNLEEEAANLIRFQQAYQAAAQVIAASRDVFETIIRATQ